MNTKGRRHAVGMGHQLTDASADTPSLLRHQVLASGLSVPSGRPIPCPKTGVSGQPGSSVTVLMFYCG